MRRTTVSFWVALVASALAGATACSEGESGDGGSSGGSGGGASVPVDAAGLYNVTLRNDDNGCDFENWVQDETTTNIGLRITQDENQATGAFEGLGGGLVALLLGTAELEGAVVGDEITLEAYSGYTQRVGNCTQNVVLTLSGSLTGNVWSGRAEYTYADNNAPDCQALDDCTSVQTFDAVRIE